MRKTTLTAVLAIGLLAVGAPAYAGGSDDPTPYIVAEDGIYLPAPDVFPDNGHVNIKTTDGKSYGLHFESRNWPDNHPKKYYIGKSFLPWTAFDKNPFCVKWVQVSLYNEHFGEGGQSPVGPGCTTPTPTPTPTPDPTPTLPPLPADEVKVVTSKPTVDCDTKVGDVVKVTRTTTTIRYDYDAYGKPVGTSSTFTEQVDYVIEAPDLFDLVCETPTPTPTPTTTQPPLPETGGTSDAVLWAAGIGFLALVGGLLMRRKKVEA